MKISTVKTKMTPFQGKGPICSKIYVDNKVTEQVNYFNYTDYYN